MTRVVSPWSGPAALAVVAALSAPLAAAQTVAPVMVASPVIGQGETIPRDYTPDGRNVSPPLTWRDLPAGTREVAVVCADFGAGSPPPWVHWVVYGIPADAGGLPEALPILPDQPMPEGLEGVVQGLNGWRRPYYRGPAPPPGTPHVYHFTVYALDARLDLSPGLTREELLRAMDGHVLGRGELVAVYERFAGPGG